MKLTDPFIERVTLSCPRLPAPFDGLTILHLSDLHITRWTLRLRRWRDQLALLRPDLLVITGDLGHRSWHWKRSVVAIERLLEPIHPRIGAFFILGNHDSLKIGPALARPDRQFLQNQAVFLPTPKPKAKSPPLPSQPSSLITPNSPSPRLALIGLHQHRRMDTDIPAAMRDVRPDDFKLMLLHYPDLIHQAVAAGADVCLAGHTHGGQICWPDGSPIIRHDVLPQNMCTGVHRINTTWMVVNRGMGVAGLRMRLFCPPHAILLTLTR